MTNIRGHSYIPKLTVAQKNKAFRGYEMYKTKADFEKGNNICIGLNRDHQLLSNLVHPLPLSIERIDNDSGRGIGSETDVNYCIMSLVVARKYLAASTIAITDFFNKELGIKYKNALDKIRIYQSV